MKLPKSETTTRELTFTVPHILKSITQDKGGFLHREIREGGSRQVQFEAVTEFSEEPVEETPFVIKVTNQLNFGGAVINVINDEVELDGFRLVPTVPTATEYMNRVGKKTMVAFHCRQDASLTKQNEDKPIYRIYRAFITLP